MKYIMFGFLFVLSSCLEDADLGNMFIADQSVDDRFEQSMEWNEKNGYTNLVSSTEDYSIIAFGDSHIGSTDNIEQTLLDANSIQALAVVMNGDITTGHKKDFDVLEEIILKNSQLNTFQLVGNHDLYFNGWENFSETFGTSSYYFTVETPTVSDLYFCLDTGSGTLGSKQLDWLRTELENNRNNYRNCFIFTHNNLFRMRRTFTTNPNVEELRVLLDLFAVYKIEMVVTGHDHIHETKQFGNTQHIIMDALQDINTNASYLKIKITSNTIDFTFEDL